MQVHEVLFVTTYVHNLYRDRFPPLTESMARIWYEDLKHLDEDLVTQAVTRWARQHTHVAPSLEQILEQVEFVRDEQRLARRSGSSTKGYLDVLKDAAAREAQSPERTDTDVRYSRLMALLAERSIDRWSDERGVWHDKMTQEQRGEQCYNWAEQYRLTHPDLAQDLEAAGRQLLLTLPLEFGD